MTDTDSSSERSGRDRQERDRTARLTVPDMDCPSCAKKIEKRLRRVDGVLESRLQPTTGTATVSYDPDRTSETAIVDAIEDVGYEVLQASGADENEARPGDVPPRSVRCSSPAGSPSSFS